MEPDAAAGQLQRAGFKGALFIVLTDAYSDDYQMPSVATTTGTADTSGVATTNVTSYGAGFGRMYRGYTNYQGTASYESTTVIQPGAMVHHPRMRFDLTFVDLRHGDVVWMSSAFTSGNAFADTRTMAESIAKKAVAALLGEALIATEVTPKVAGELDLTENIIGTAVVSPSTAVEPSGPSQAQGPRTAPSQEPTLAIVTSRRAVGSLSVAATACPILPSTGLFITEINGVALSRVPIAVERIEPVGSCQEVTARIPLRLFLDRPQHGVNHVVIGYEVDGQVATAGLSADIGL